jgi:hypothetical protein
MFAWVQRRRPSPPRVRVRFHVEQLEDRLIPSVSLDTTGV